MQTLQKRLFGAVFSFLFGVSPKKVATLHLRLGGRNDTQTGSASAGLVFSVEIKMLHPSIPFVDGCKTIKYKLIAHSIKPLEFFV